MEIFYTLLGLAALYSWIHIAVIIIKKVKGMTSYETVVMIFGAVFFGLYVIGTL